jgi:hypothetical protein
MRKKLFKKIIMIKRYQLVFAFIFTSFVILAQSSLLVTNVTGGGSVITNSMVIYRTVGVGVMDHMDINIKNISTSTKSYKMRMYYDLRHVVAPGDSSNPYFCFGTSCFPVNTLVSANSITLTANQTVSGTSVHYDESYTAAGASNIRYKIYDMNNASVDFIEFTVKYNDPLASVKTNTALFLNVSDVYPNPSNTKAFITINTITDVNSAALSITNSLGAIVSSKNIELNVGKNVIPLDVETLSSGIYFTTITSGNSKIVKKIIINK